MLPNEAGPNEAAPNDEMVEYWNGVGGTRWVSAQDRYDQMLDPVSAPMLDLLDPQPGDRLLDIGCGPGSVTLQVARRLDGQGLVTGLDVSHALLELAAARVGAEGLGDVVELVEGDAQIHPFAPGAATAVTSRFGVMFFADPTAAFANLGRATSDGARLAMTVWQTREANEWMDLPMSISGRIISAPPTDPTAPGPCALGDADRTRTILEDAGWRDVEIVPSVGTLLLGGPGTFAESISFVVDHGTLSRLLIDADPSDVERVRTALIDELADRHDGTGLRLGYAVWLITATR